MIDKFQFYQKIKTSLDGLDLRSSNDRVGSLILDAENISLLKSLASSALVDSHINNPNNFVDSVEIERLGEEHYGKTYEITLKGSLIKNRYFLGESWDEFLSHSSYLLNPPDAIYLNDKDVIIGEVHTNANFENFKSISSLVQIVERVKDYSDSTHWGMIYGNKIKIDKAIDKSILDRTINTEPINRILLEDSHTEAKENLLKKTIVKFVSDCDEKKRLEFLVENFERFVSEFLLNFETYVSNYSFDKVRSEYEEKRTEYIAKVNNVFQDISTKLIIMPAPLWLAITQVNSNGDSLINYKKFGIAAITILVAIYLAATLYGQYKLLESVKKEYTALFLRLKSEYKTLTDSGEVPPELKSRYESVWWQLNIASIVGVVLVVLSLIIVVESV